MPSEITTESGYHIGQDEKTLRLLSQRTARTCLGYLLPTLHSLPPTFKLLDVGCGPASITFDLAKIFPRASIIGVDFSATVIERNIGIQKQRLEQKNGENGQIGGRCEFRVGDILNPSSFLAEEEIGTFDVVSVHTSLINIPDSVEALRQMRSIARKGGIVAARDGDLRSQILFPPCDEYTRLIQAMYAHDKTDIETGRKLISLALKAGWNRVEIEASASVLTTIPKEDRSQFSLSMIGNLENAESDVRKIAEKLGFDGERQEVIKSELRRFMDAEDGWRIIICTEVICQSI
ncbi:S-adenosyl-L-methionine-dependent methyltransferase [Bisporella sp. PMI_857]|nr:S-adenosyl-L-methionine-dependent methyltransferase [Bisporella sp. PMI_857]